MLYGFNLMILEGILEIALWLQAPPDRKDRRIWAILLTVKEG